MNATREIYVTGLALLTVQNAHVNEPYDSALESIPVDVLPHAWKNIESTQNTSPTRFARRG